MIGRLKEWEYAIMVTICSGPTLSSKIYDFMGEGSEQRVRGVLKSLQEKEWAECVGHVKTNDGPGRPMKIYALTERGQMVLRMYEDTLEEARSGKEPERN